ncbi:MAG: ATP-binding cassette domain-containing protein [Myxococcota bacterium]
MIEARELIKHYGARRVLDRASLKIASGECVVLTGDNGSGKTTLLHVLVGMRGADGGHVLWKDERLTGRGRKAWRRARAAWGFLPQQVFLPPHARVGHLLQFHTRLRGASVQRARHWLERVGLTGSEDQRVGALSGGMRQRLATALVFFHEPELIVMDEPRSNLDPTWRTALVEWVGEATARGAGVLVTSQLRRGWPPDARYRRCEGGRVLEPEHGGEEEAAE